MPSYHYKALTADGRITEDVLEAGSRREALARLTALGLTLVHLGEDAGDAARDTVAVRGAQSAVPAKAREAFTRQLAALLGAGVPLATALNRLAHETQHRRARETWSGIHDLVADGASLADAMTQYPRTFPRVYTAMVRAGETGGFLELVLGQIADFQERERDLRSRVLSALLYPAVLAVMCVGVVVFLLTFFIPRFQSMFADFGAALPPLTLVIIGLSDWLRRWGLLVAVVLILGVLLFQRWRASEAGGRRLEGWLLEIPVFGALTARFAMTRFCRMLGTLCGAGVPLVMALRVAGESLGNQVLVDAVRDAIQNVCRGSRLADSLATCSRLFPGSVIEIISVAEQTARLDQELTRLADSSEKELDRQLRAAVALAEPAMLFVMAAVIGTIVVGMVLPIFTLQDYIK